MPNLFKTLFPEKIVAQKEFDFDKKESEELIKKNRETLSLVDNWIDEDAFKKSFFSYGVPDYIRKDINKPINNSATYTDLILYLSKKHFAKINYLEIGVSVGKNFFQLLNAHTDSKFTGFDIEELNPVVEHLLYLKEKTEWQTPANSIKKTPSSLKEFAYNNMHVNYLCGDVWDENSWGKLQGNKFNIVFSDALHTPEAILFEFEMLVKFDLLAEKFIIVWDDLVGKMQKSFYKIIRKYDRKYQIKDIYLLNINGWIGEHEKPHTVGVISNFLL
jgi:methyltransferase family protein